ncbi:MAG: neutral/alkaline non-lysosomal ceramidase N-terminal domain-containing protein, partial [Bryobacteraceae bacterium]
MRTVAALLLLCLPATAEFRAGVARANITPELPVWLTGYALRNHTANHVTLDLWAKALALDDGHRGRIVIVTTDLIGLPREISDEVAARCSKQFGLKRSELLMNSSHTHSGPAVWPNLRVMFDMSPEDEKRTRDYARKLTGQLVQIAGDALHDLSPARISYGQATADFSINRRIARLRELNPGKDFPAPVDHGVPVLRVTGRDGKLRAVLFGYACHNTTLTGEFYEVSGDYAGFAQAALERAHPGAQAMFMLLCGGDQNPNPRSRMDLPEKHGNELAASVERVLASAMPALEAPVRTAFEYTTLPFAPHTRATFEEEAKSTDIFKVRRAKLMLDDYDHNRPIRSVHYPVQAVRIGRRLVILALGGEVVLDYSIRAKREYPNLDLVVAGYSNDVMSYIPSA